MPGAFSIDHRHIHKDAECSESSDHAEVNITTPSQIWSYAVSYPIRPLTGAHASTGPAVVRIEATATSGRIGVGAVMDDQKTYISEIQTVPEDGPRSIELKLESLEDCHAIVVRNTADTGVASRLSLRSIKLYRAELEPSPYLVNVQARDYELEPEPEDGSISVFDDEIAAPILEVRLEHLEGLALPIEGKRVLDVGCGVGHFARFYRDKGCAVLAIDGRADNIEKMGQLNPDVEGHVADVQSEPLDRFGKFQVIHCYGLLYHLENPIAALRHMYTVCEEFIALETDLTPLDRSSFNVSVGTGPIKEERHEKNQVYRGADHREAAGGGSGVGQGREHCPGL